MTDKISSDLMMHFGFVPVLKQCSLDLGEYYNPTRRQYDANMILRRIAEHTLPDAFKTIGILRVDLFIPILTYIFGQSFLNGSTSIASLYRLRNELYGLEPDSSLLAERFRKVVLHEMGHSFGLIHCLNSTCIMRSSTYVEDLDQKELSFCSKCSDILDRQLINSEL